MRILTYILTLSVLVTNSASSQWSTPAPIDSIWSTIYSEPTILGIGIGPQRQLAVIALGLNGVIASHFSTDNGRSFTRTTIDSSYVTGYIKGFGPDAVESVAFDSKSHLFVLWRGGWYDDAIGGYYYDIAKSTDGGRSFSRFWATQALGGAYTGLRLTKAAMFIDNDDRIHLLWDDVNRYPEGYVYTSLSSDDSSDAKDFFLPVLPDSESYRDFADIVAHVDSVSIALSVRGNQNLYRLYLLESTDGGNNFSAKLVDSNDAKNPRLLRLNNRDYLAYTQGKYDTVLVIREMLDTNLLAPTTLLTDINVLYDPIAVRTLGDSIFVAFQRWSPNPGVSFYQITPTGVIIDSMFMADHRTPDVAVDSFGGKYLITSSQNHLLLTSKDVVLKIENETTVHPGHFQLFQNWPNPFNPSTSIRYQVPKTSEVQLEVFDVLGREVSVLLNEVIQPGSYEVKFDGSLLSSGVYFYRLKSAGYFESKKMLLLK